MSAKLPYNQQPPPWSPTPSPSPSPSPSPTPIPSTYIPTTSTITTTATSALTMHQPPPSKQPIDFSPPLIAMVIVAAAAFLLVTFSRHLFPPLHRLAGRYRRWHRCRRLRPHFTPSDVGSFSTPPPPYESSDGFYVYSPYGVDESVIKKIPLTIYKPPKSTKSLRKLGFSDHVEEFFHDCAVCLLEFEDGDYVRTLPMCYHSFHVDCIDIWLKSHATCPLCRAGVFFPPLPESPMTPLMAARIRPSLDLESSFLEPLPQIHSSRNDELFSPDVRRSNRRELHFLLKRSHSFSFERSFPSERLAVGAATTPHRHHHHHDDHNRWRSFWMKRPSSTPFTAAAKSRAFSFRMKSPAFFRRRGGSFFPMSESSASLRYGGGSSKRMKTFASPVGAAAVGVFSSSRMRLGDPEALISPERYVRM